MGAPKMAPRAFPRKRSTTLQHLFDLDPKSSPAGDNGGGFLPPPPPEPETDELLSLISHCTHVFTFTDPSDSPSQQDLKCQKLLQLLSTIRTSKRPLTGRILSPLFAMLSANLFRPLPPPSYSCAQSDSIHDDSAAVALTPSWPHLQIVYDLLSVIVGKEDPKALRSHIDRAFLSNLLCLFQMEDPRERGQLKNAYHQIYSRMTFHRAFMRKSVSNVFLNFAFEVEQYHCGIGELLEIWGSIINGFIVPLKEEHKVFLMRVLIPMHKPKGLQMYHRQLAYCVSQFVIKEPELAEVVVRGILRHWPVTNCQKEVLLIGELQELLENTRSDQYVKLALPLCSQIARCLNSCNSLVAERALDVWNNEKFMSMASQSMEEVLPEVVEGIEKNIARHWSKSVRQLTVSVKKMLEETEPRLYAKCLREFHRRESMAGDQEMKRKQKWDTLQLAAARGQFLQQPNYVPNPQRKQMMCT